LILAVLWLQQITLAQEYVPDANTVTLYHFNETSGSAVADTSGNGNNGAAHGTTIVDGKFGKARSFNGGGDYVECGNNSILNGAWAGLTLEAWIRPASTVVGDQLIVGKWANNAPQDHFVLILHDNKLQIAVGDGTNAEPGLRDSAVLTSNNWYHVAGTWTDIRIYKLFINGRQVASGSQVGNGINTSSSVSLKIGRQMVGVDRPFNGLIDEVRISNKAREPWEFNYPVVKSVTPSQNALNIAESTNISATFNRSMNISTLTASNILVHGSQSGKHTGTITVSGDTSFAFDPSTDFKPGEIVTVNLTRNIVSAAGDTLTNGYHWQFTVAVGGGMGVFSETASLSAGGHPSLVVTGDFDGDGDLDMAVQPVDSNLSIWENDGHGVFVRRSSVAVGRYNMALISGDWNGDGYLDLGVADAASAKLYILTNDGHASFTAAAISDTGGVPGSLTTGDFDGDGDLDLAVTEYTVGIVSIFTNTGAGVFTRTSAISVGGYLTTVATGDLDGDGDLDLAVCSNSTNRVSILWNDGSGTFGQRSHFNLPGQQLYIAAADFDGDHDLDLCVTNYTDTTVTILVNDGIGNFAQPLPPIRTGGTAPVGIAPADLDGDGDLDLAVTNSNSSTVGILRNDGFLNFQLLSTPSVGQHPQLVTAGDFDADGDLDLATGNYYSNTVSILRNGGWEQHEPHLIRIAQVHIKNGSSWLSYLPRELPTVDLGDSIRFEGVVTDQTGSPLSDTRVICYNSYLYDTLDIRESLDTVITNSSGHFFYPKFTGLECSSDGLIPFWFAVNDSIATPFLAGVRGSCSDWDCIKDSLSNWLDILDVAPGSLVGIVDSSDELFFRSYSYPPNDSNLTSTANDEFFEGYVANYHGPVAQPFLSDTASEDSWLYRGLARNHTRLQGVLNTFKEYVRRQPARLLVLFEKAGDGRWIKYDFNRSPKYIRFDWKKNWKWINYGIEGAVCVVGTAATAGTGVVAACGPLVIDIVANEVVKPYVVTPLCDDFFTSVDPQKCKATGELITDIAAWGATIWVAGGFSAADKLPGQEIGKHIGWWQNPRNLSLGRLRAGAMVLNDIKSFGSGIKLGWEIGSVASLYFPEEPTSGYQAMGFDGLTYKNSTSPFDGSDFGFANTFLNQPGVTLNADFNSSESDVNLEISSNRSFYQTNTIISVPPAVTIASGGQELTIANLVPSLRPNTYTSTIPFKALPNYAPDQVYSATISASGNDILTNHGIGTAGFGFGNCTVGTGINIGDILGSYLQIPPHSVSSDILVSFGPAGNGEDFAGKAFQTQLQSCSLSLSSFSQLGQAYKITPPGLHLLSPATLRLRVDSSSFQDASLRFRLGWYDTTKIGWIDIGGVYDLGNGWVTAEITKSGLFSILGSEFSTTAVVDHAPGWNLISVPVLVADHRRSFLFPEAISSAFAYSGVYVAKDSLISGKGYWLKFDASGGSYVVGTTVLMETVSVRSGWNLIGSISDSVAVGAIACAPPGIEASNYFGYNGYNGAYYVADVIAPGHGYWIKANDSGKIMLSTGGSLAKGRDFREATGSLNQFGTLTMMDAGGKKQELKFGMQPGADFRLSYFELPPLPPEGSFDARFASNRMLEVVAEGKTQVFPISISSADWPINIRWEVKDLSVVPSLIINGKEIPMEAGRSVVVSNPQSAIALRLIGSSNLPKAYALDQNYPNPFNPSTVIRYELPAQSKVSLRIYNVLGQEVKTLVDGIRDAGYESVEWDASQVASGLYFYRMDAVGVADPSRSFTQVRKLIVIR